MTQNINETTAVKEDSEYRQYARGLFESALLTEDAEKAKLAGNRGKDQNYSADYDTGAHFKTVDKALAHANAKGYKINHNDGMKPDHTKPDVTFHYAMGDDEPHAYTVHHDGAAAHDRSMHRKAIHMGDED